MELIWPLATVVGVALVVLVLVATLVPWRRRRRDDALLVAHSDRLRRLPRFRALARSQARVRAVQTVALLLTASGTVLLAGRPAHVDATPPEARSRDIMLCLDVSASMDPYNVAVVEQVRSITSGLQGERIGMTIWNGTSVSVFPLTDDYDFVQQELDDAIEAIESYDFSFIAGTFNEEERSSLIGDGMVSCAQRFDRPQEERGRAIVLASDNDPQGEPVFPLDEAAAYVADHGIVLYAIGVPAMDPAKEAALRQAADTTGGQYYPLGDGYGDDSAAAIVAGIQSLEQERLDDEPVEPVVTEQPGLGAGLAGAGVGLLALTGLATVRRRR